ncbi:HET-domain-containing protein [Viridothelium virens]|uniref:HET-domain-containing protein n=1 Tax=Viridothelium virens TaxID=1048519 RepID=A0A6A6GZP0_VIRVR|nr:HET-domain-containing protein [Viridothelium virens]
MELTEEDKGHVQPQSDTHMILDTAYRLLNVCNLLHTVCMTAGTTHTLPTRVVDVGNSKRLPSLCLSNGRSDRYCTLSYCWGSSSGWFNTTSDNLSKRTQFLPFTINGKPMPKTYHDAIVITRRLGIRYVWIDALCIIQDSAEDWQRESAKMREIYRNSYCTIAATGSTDVEEGILNFRPAQQLSTSEVVFGQSRPKITYFGRHLKPTIPDKTRLIVDATFSNRGWIFQEMLLSPRTLHFTAHCLYFDCLSGTSSELDSVDNPRPSEDPDLSLKKVLIDQRTCHSSTAYAFWWNIIYEFTRKDLTKEADRLPAISGIASRIHMNVADYYVAGLWQNELVEGLQWVVATEYERVPERLPRRPNIFVAPSWSWASVIGPISSAKMPLSKWKTDWDAETWSSALEIVDVKVELVNADNIYGQVTSGLLRVRGRIKKVDVSHPRNRIINGLLEVPEGKGHWPGKYWEDVIRFDVLEEHLKPSERNNLCCLEVYRCIKKQPSSSWYNHPKDAPVPPNFSDTVCFHALVLRPTGLHQYQRVGFAKLTTRTYFDGCDIHTVDII